VNFHEARAQFPVLDEVAYLNAGSMGPLARATVEAMAAQQLADLELGRGGLPYIDTMLELRKRVRAGLAATICVPPENLALTTSTTDCCNIVLSVLRLRPGPAPRTAPLGGRRSYDLDEAVTAQPPSGFRRILGRAVQ
jgi:selenocysteine lyase/cysteine desulfurase